MLEVMVVVVIIAILASFAMPQYAKTQEKGLDSEAKANLVLIQAAENLYITESDAFYGAAGASAHTDLNKELNTNLPLS